MADALDGCASKEPRATGRITSVRPRLCELAWRRQLSARQRLTDAPRFSLVTSRARRLHFANDASCEAQSPCWAVAYMCFHFVRPPTHHECTYNDSVPADRSAMCNMSKLYVSKLKLDHSKHITTMHTTLHVHPIKPYRACHLEQILFAGTPPRHRCPVGAPGKSAVARAMAVEAVAARAAEATARAAAAGAARRRGQRRRGRRRLRR